MPEKCPLTYRLFLFFLRRWPLYYAMKAVLDAKGELENRRDIWDARESLQEDGSVPWEQVKNDLGLDGNVADTNQTYWYGDLYGSP